MCRAAGVGQGGRRRWWSARIGLTLLGWACAGRQEAEPPSLTAYTPVELSGALSCESSAATGISDDQLIVGWCQRQGRVTAFKYQVVEQMTILPRLSGSVDDRAHDVSLSGIIVGESRGRAVQWLPGGAAEVVPGLPDDRYSTALGVDREGRVTGMVTRGGAPEPFRWDPGAGTIIGAGLVARRISAPSPVLEFAGLSLRLDGGNEAGSRLASVEGLGARRWAVVRPDGRSRALPPLPGDSVVEPLELSETCEWVVGASVSTTGRRRATWWKAAC